MNPQSTIQQALAEARQRLSPYSESPKLDAEVWLAHLLEQPRAWLLAHPEKLIDGQSLAAYRQGIEQMEAGRPLPYLLGSWEFFGITFRVDERVLIPRPETELLVEQALEWLKGFEGQAQAADMGTGSGCIAIAIASNASNVHFEAGDISDEALVVAAENVRRHSLGGRVRLLQSDVMAEMTGPYDLICANLPYIPSEHLADLAVVKSEPILALDGGPHGMALLKRLLNQAAERIATPGLILAEIDLRHAREVENLAQASFSQGNIAILKDLAGKERLLTIRLEE